MSVISLNSKIFIILCFLTSTIFLLLSMVLIAYIFPMLINEEIDSNVELTEGTDQYDRFLEVPFPVDFKVYFFDVQNPQNILQGSKPIVKEVGPYVYKQYIKRYVKQTNKDEDTVSYTQTEKFVFDQDTSGNLSEHDYINVLNAPMISVLQTAESFGQANALSSCIGEIFGDNNSLFIKAKVREILFDGIPFCFRRFSFCEFRKTIACKIAETKKYVDKLEDGSLKFSFFNYKTNENQQLFTIMKGVKNIEMLGQMVKINNSSNRHVWTKEQNNSKCDRISGTDSTLYPPHLKRNSELQIYITDICRHFDLKFLSEETYKNIKGFAFTTRYDTLKAVSSSKESDCFCSKQTKGINGEDTCFLDGVIDIQPCTGVPVLLSFPHFLWANETYINNVDGLSPNANIHKSTILVEPNTGTPLQLAVRMQINAVVRPIDKIKSLKKVSRFVLPLLWVEESVALPESFVEKLKGTYFNKVLVLDVVKWGLLSVSLASTLVFSGYLFSKNV